MSELLRKTLLGLKIAMVSCERILSSSRKREKYVENITQSDNFFH